MMQMIAVTDRGRNSDGSFDVRVQFQGGGEHSVRVSDPFDGDSDNENLLAWYFEEHLRYPFLDRDRAKAAVDLLTSYGINLFSQLFTQNDACSYEFRRARDTGFDGLRIEIVGGVEFHRFHWEALREEGPGTPLGARIPIVRRIEDVEVGFDIADRGPVLNVLVVTARPRGSLDVGYRTISRPLLAALRQARIPVSVDLVRPGTWRALADHLQETSFRHGSGWYGIVHFDVHGAVTNMTELEDEASGDYLLTDMSATSSGEDAYLFFETGEVGVAEPVSTSMVADLLVEHRVPVAVMNACQSAMHTKGSEANLAQRLVEAGVPVAVGMAYSVTVSAAELMMPVLYKQLAEGTEILPAIHAARRRLFDIRGRRAYFNHEVDLEDWVLPVAFSQRPIELQPKNPTPDQIEKLYANRAWHVDEPDPEYGFVGRDLDVQAIERQLLGENGHNELLVSGMAGAGKSTLLEHLGWWWQTTGLVERVFVFSYEERAWSVDQILQTLIAELFEGSERAIVQSLSTPIQLERVATLLRAERHLLILDNAESITASPASIPHSLPEQERNQLKRLLSRLKGGKTLVLIGSRGPEEWLASDSFVSNTYELRGLDPQATSILLERILARHGARLPDDSSERSALEELVEVLGGYPLPLTVVLPSLASALPSAVLSELKKGEAGADPEKIIQRAVEFSHGRLDPAMQNSLAVLAPFTGVVPQAALDRYGELLQDHPEVEALGPLDLSGALDQAVRVGLARPEPHSLSHVRVQPLFPYFLRARLKDQSGLTTAVYQSFHDLYQVLGPTIHVLLVSADPVEQEAGRKVAALEYANLMTALDHALESDSPSLPLVGPLEEYLSQTHQEHSRQGLLERVISVLGEPPLKERRRELAIFHRLAGIAALSRHDLAAAWQHNTSELELDEELEDQAGAAGAYHQMGRVKHSERRLDEAEGYYKKALEIQNRLEERHSAASSHHQLGIIAQELRRFDEAEAHYKQALEIKLEFNDRSGAAVTHHQLGRVDQERRRLEEAKAHYEKALEIKLEFNDRHSAASTHHQLGSIAQEQRHFDEAEAHYRKALEIYNEFNDRYETADTYHQLGIVAQEQRRFDEAEAHYRKALEIYDEFNDRYQTADTYHQLGRVEQERGRLEEAQARYRKALEVSGEFDERHEAAATYHQLGRVEQERGRLDEAEAHFRKATELCGKFDDPAGGSISRSQLGIVLTQLDRAAEAIPHSLGALMIRFQLMRKWSKLDLMWLKRQRRLVGSEAFDRAVAQAADTAMLNQVLPLLEQVDEPDTT